MLLVAPVLSRVNLSSFGNDKEMEALWCQEDYQDQDSG